MSQSDLADIAGGNLFEGGAPTLDHEFVESLLESRGFRLERIVSRGHAGPLGQWYDQELREWVVLLSGRAGLRFEGESTTRILEPGDWVDIPAHRRHRVEWTANDVDTAWLTLHYGN